MNSEVSETHGMIRFRINLSLYFCYSNPLEPDDCVLGASNTGDPPKQILNSPKSPVWKEYTYTENFDVVAAY